MLDEDLGRLTAFAVFKALASAERRETGCGSIGIAVSLALCRFRWAALFVVRKCVQSRATFNGMREYSRWPQRTALLGSH